MPREEQIKAWRRIIARAWMDDRFKDRLLNTPAEVFREEGLEIPPDLEVRVLENTMNLTHFVIPAKPGAVSPEDLEDRLAAGGGGVFGMFLGTPIFSP